MASENIFDLTGRVCLVTGGSRGLGKAMARAFAQHGACVMICARGEKAVAAAAREISEEFSSRVEWMCADMSDRAAAAAVAAETLKRFGRVDVLVNNAGGNCPQRVDQITDESWDTNLEVNLSAAMRLTRAVLPQMMERKWGRIIHISSILGMGGRKDRNIYSAAKAALIGLARTSALDLGPFGITVNCIAPGPFLTERLEDTLSDEQQQAFCERSALNRWGRPPEIAGAALLLATNAGSYITGSTLVVDGGVLANTL